MKAKARSFLPPNRHGIAVDAIAIIANLFLFPLIFSRVGNLFDESFADNAPAFKTLAGLMVFILAGRLFGLYLKRFPLQTRLETSGQTSFPMYFFMFNVGVFVLNAAFVMVFVTSVFGELGLVETGYGGRPKDSQAVSVIGALAMFAMMCTEIYLIYRLSRRLTDREKMLRAKGNWMFGWIGEFAADFGLFAYMMIWQAFYNNIARLFMTPAPNVIETLELKIFSAVFLFICFLLFYLSPRTIFLIEDRKYLGTWVFILGVYISSVLRYW